MTPAYLSAMWRAIAPALGNHLWQSTLFAVAAGLLTLILRKNHARARYWLWLTASAKFLIPFSLLINLGNLLSWARGSAEIKAPVFITAWLCGFVVVLFAWCVRWRRVAAAMREAAPLREGREIDALRRLEPIAGKPIEIVLSRASLEPGIFGIARPVLIWPEGISKHLEDAHLEAILAHEVWHVRRRDNLAAAIHMVVEAIFWFHPLVWWLGGRLVEERERACDEEVVEFGSERQVYAESILKVCEFCVGSPLACVSGVTGSDLKKRMVDIMNERIARKLDFGRKLLLSTAGVLALTLPLIFGLVNAPQIRAQEQTENAGATISNVDVSIKPSELSTQTYAASGVHLVKMMYSPTGFKAANASLQTIIQEAYGVQASQIAHAPEWIKTAAYDVQIETGDKANDAGREESPEQRRARGQRVLQGILAGRFKLNVHREIRELPSYALVIAEDGGKLQPAKPAGSYPDGIKGPEGRLMGTSMRMKLDGGQAVGMDVRNASTADLASQLSRQLGSVVVDKTGLTGNYDFALNWTSDASQNPEASASSLFTALQEQLGLKLEPQKAPMEVLIIDHVERQAKN